MKILMGTKNPGKIQGAKEAFEKYFDNVEIQGIAVNSEVGDLILKKECNEVDIKNIDEVIIDIIED